ncbi:hypothetical protein GWI33_002708 [Rhynchophorus ferrugineus]|uniref:C2H2-type domain-containing protein n=1 Tax=Rhynchophorus ferrugineus TaxID=354439 RepID=A0A834IM71_RHYFE|nr:hypothetical protein GWI33_002708 [Rhynchophorus ferrugineus]
MTENLIEIIIKEESPNSHVTCSRCWKQFQCVKYLNNHLRRVHKITASNKISRIICPLCEEKKEFQTFRLLQSHLDCDHGIMVEFEVIEFLNIQDYETWKEEHRIKTAYAVRNVKKRSDFKEIHYYCNRSNLHGYTPNYKIRRPKSQGSIKINGTCPSRLASYLYDNGMVTVKYWKTHAGHKEELRCQHLSAYEKKVLVQKLKSGLTTDMILADVRNTKDSNIQRIHLINKDDLYNLKKKHNIKSKEISSHKNMDKYYDAQVDYICNTLKSLKSHSKAQAVNKILPILQELEANNDQPTSGS